MSGNDAAARGEHQRTTKSPPATSATLPANGTKVAPRPGVATSSPTDPGQPYPLIFRPVLPRPWPGLQVPPRGLADRGQAPGDDLPPGPPCRARRYRAVPGRLRGQATGSGDGRQARYQAPDAVGELSQRRVEAARVAGRHRVRDGPVHRRASPSSSWARSHTVITRSPSCRTSLMCRGRSRGSGRRWRSAAAMAPGSIAAAGCVPADTAGTLLARRHSAAARCERAELAVQTNSTRSAARAAGGGQRVQGAGDQLQVGAAAVAFRPAPGDDPGLFQHMQVVRQQVRRHSQHGGQLGGGRVPCQQRVGDLQPGRVGERGVHCSTPGQVRGWLRKH